MKSYFNIKSFNKPDGIFINSLRLIFLTLLTFYLSEIFAQDESAKSKKTDTVGYVNVKGYIEKNNKPLENASIIVYEGDKKLADKKTASDGKFSLKFGYNRYFKVEITKPGLVLKKFEFDTHIPANIDKKSIYPFDFTIVLFSKYKDIDLSIFDKPLAIIRYSPQFLDFFYDIKYSKPLNDKANIMQKKSEELTAQYTKCMKDGIKFYDSLNYEKALSEFTKANDIFPEEPEPIHKIEAINKILKRENSNKQPK